MALRVESTSVADGQPIAEIHAVATPTADGKAEMAGRDLSPHLRWSGEPEGTRSFAISVVDPDVPADRTRMGVEGLSLGDDEPRVDFAHWLVADIPPRSTSWPRVPAATASSPTASRPSRPRSGRSRGRTGTAGCSRATPTSREPTAGGTARSRRGTTSTSIIT